MKFGTTALQPYSHSTDAPEIKKLMGYWDRQEPIAWVKVNDLPDHVYFPHMMHIRAKIDCSCCHGQVAAMERISRTASLKMGWCLSCHRQQKLARIEHPWLSST